MAATTRALSPHLLLAEHLARQLDVLLPWLQAQRPEVREQYLDVLAGLCRGEDAMRALADDDLDGCLQHLHASLAVLEPLEPGELDGLHGPFTPR